MEAPLTSATALYLYGIVEHPIRGPRDADFASWGGLQLPRCDAVEDGTAIDLIAADRVACVVSPVLSRQYESSATGRNASEQLDWVTPRAWRHHDVIRQLHLATTVIPLKFGTLCGSVGDVHGLLERCSGQIRALLDRFRGRDEWTLSIRIDGDRVIERIEHEDPELRELCAVQQTLPDGRSYFVRKKRQQRGRELLAAEVAAMTRDVYARIARHVDGCCEDDSDARAAMVLIERARFEEVTRCLADLEADFAINGLALELRGPWAPYSFVKGELRVGN